MSLPMLAAIAARAPETIPEVIPLGEVRMVREDCWREVQNLLPLAWLRWTTCSSGLAAVGWGRWLKREDPHHGGRVVDWSGR